MTKRLVVISAGLSTPSSTRLLADRLSAAVVAQSDVEVHNVELRTHARDIADNLVTGFANDSLQATLDAVQSADGLIVVTPVFNASYSGLFKSFFDILDKQALEGKPLLVAATAGTARHSLVIDHAMRPMFAYLRANVMPTGVFAATEDWASGGISTELNGRIERAASELARAMDNQTTSRDASAFKSFEQLLHK